MKEMFEDTAERLLSDLVTPELITAAEQGVWPGQLWAAIEENGLTLAAVPEQHGGVGGTLHDAFALFRAVGRHAAPVPLAETIIANWLLGMAGQDAVAGAATIAVAEDATFDGARFTGTLPDVAWGRAAAHVVTIVDGVAVLLATADADASIGLNVAREPRDTLRFVGTAAIGASLPSGAPADLVLMAGALIRSAQIVGGLRRLLDLSIDYANQRAQFGRPIGKFQAIQHQIAVLAEQAAIAASAAEAACATSAPWPSMLPVASAKSVTSEAAGQGAAIAHAVLGAIGFTYEHSLHLTTRRLWSWRSEFGSQTLWATRIGQAMCRGGAGAYWPSLTADVACA